MFLVENAFFFFVSPGLVCWRERPEVLPAKKKKKRFFAKSEKQEPLLHSRKKKGDSGFSLSREGKRERERKGSKRESSKEFAFACRCVESLEKKQKQKRSLSRRAGRVPLSKPTLSQETPKGEQSPAAETTQSATKRGVGSFMVEEDREGAVFVG